MKLLLCDKYDYNQLVRPFEEHLERYARRMAQEAQAGMTAMSLYRDKPHAKPLLERYTSIFRWPIRRLEYSYVLAEVGPIAHSHRTLDAGCGIAPLAHYIAAQGADAHAVDGDAALIEILDREAEAVYGGQVQYDKADITALAFPDNRFDIVTCVSVLEHLPRGADVAAVREMLRVLKPSGSLVITVDIVADDWRPEFAKPPNRPGIIRRITSPIRLPLRLLRRWLTPPSAPSQPSFAKASTRPYFFEEVIKHLVKPFEPLLVGKVIEKKPLTTLQLRQFWRDHWFDGAGYDPIEGRTYAALGFVLTKRNQKDRLDGPQLR
jgi:2-polyprenyl-3-methyl-5-hydroxy-6-metoxy-1,4-benzoquinol methylase